VGWKFVRSGHRAQVYLRNVRKGVRNQYRQVLGRVADSKRAVDFWSNKVKTKGWQFVHGAFLKSAEYKKKYGLRKIPGKKKAYRKVVARLYKQLLNRKPNKKGLKYWSKCFNRNGPKKCFKAFVRSVFGKGKKMNKFWGKRGHKIVLKRSQ